MPGQVCTKVLSKNQPQEPCVANNAWHSQAYRRDVDEGAAVVQRKGRTGPKGEALGNSPQALRTLP
jgi:hypothetical protein